MIFHEATLRQNGDLASEDAADTDTLHPDSLKVFRDFLSAHKRVGDWKATIPYVPDVAFSYTSEEPGIAMATFWWSKSPVCTCLYLDGRNPEHEQVAIKILQTITTTLHKLGMEPGFDVLGLTKRPIAISVPIISDAPIDRIALVGEMSRLVGAAYFLGLEG
jgi:hypothetical protein